MHSDAKAYLMQRMHLADVFTRKLALMPFDLANPVWVEDEDIDLDYHVRHVTLPAPGSNRQLQQYVKLVKAVPTMLRSARNVLVPDKDETGKRNWRLPRNFKLFAPRTSLNVAITNQRSFAGRTVPLAEVKQIAKLVGVSLNDVVMGTVAGALREYLKANNELPTKPLAAAVPVSLREAGDDTANNQVSMVIMNLATDVLDPVARLRKINESSSSSKAMIGRVRAAIPTDFPMLAAPWLMSGVASLYGRSRLANVLPPLANVLISNVAGIPVQLYFAGAKIVSYYPVSIPAHGMALNITVQSYNGRLDYGLIACRRALPDAAELADALLAEHRKLLELALALHAVPAAPALAGGITKAAPEKKTAVRRRASTTSTARPDPTRTVPLKLVGAKPARRAPATAPATVRKRASRVAPPA